MDYISDLLRLLVRLVIVMFDFMVRFFDIDIGVFLLEKVGIVFVICYRNVICNCNKKLLMWIIIVKLYK